MSSYEPGPWRTPRPMGSVGILCRACFSGVVIYSDEDRVDVLAELRALRREVEMLKKELARRDLEQRVPRDLAEHIVSFN